ncbi:hypothetical protein ES705_27210 [subsurface metagenome]
MKKHTDSYVLQESKKNSSKQKKEFSSYGEFHQRYQEYQRKKNGKSAKRSRICRPYNELFNLPKKEETG